MFCVVQDAQDMPQAGVANGSFAFPIDILKMSQIPSKYIMQ